MFVFRLNVEWNNMPSMPVSVWTVNSRILSAEPDEE